MTTETPVMFGWKAAYCVGIPEIDAQHQTLVKLINTLQDAIVKGTGNRALSSIIADLIRYTKVHFAFEEDMLQRKHYPGLAAHKKEHVELTRQVCELRDDFQAGKMMVTMDVMKFLQKWLSDHILEKDHLYAKELNG